jgi:dCMP deaminase
MKRPNWDNYFIDLAHVVKSRSSCVRDRIGAVVVQDKRIIATGYNGTPAGVKNCSDGGCQRCMDRHNDIVKANERKDLCICIHAEMNALLQSAYHGVSTKGATLYATVAPCLQCAKSLINSGIGEIIYEGEYTDDFGLKLLMEAGVKVRRYK